MGKHDKFLYDNDKVLDYMETIKQLYEMLLKDMIYEIKQLSQFQDFFQQFNITNDIMFGIVNDRMNIIYDYFYKTIVNIISIKTNVKGLGEYLIKPVNQIYGTVNIIKYQNTIKCTESFNLQNTVTIGTCDNFKIDKLYQDDIFIGITIIIGKITFNIYNFNKLILDDLIIFGHNQVITNIQESINVMFEFIDTQIKTIGDMLICIETNINYLKKYINKFKELSCCDQFEKPKSKHKHKKKSCCDSCKNE